MTETTAFASPNSESGGRVTRDLLACGIAAGPLYIVVGLIEALTRPGFDPTRDDLSLLSNGDFGWVHIGLFVTTGLLTVAGAVGMRRALAGERAGTWGPLLLGLYGVGLIGAGIFIADPARGFPPGTPADAHAVSWHGLMHLVSGAIGFIGLIAACMVFARRFAALGRRRLAVYSVVTGVLFAAAFVGIASGSQQGGAVVIIVTLAFTAAVVIGWTWVSVVSALVMRSGSR